MNKLVTKTIHPVLESYAGKSQGKWILQSTL